MIIWHSVYWFLLHSYAHLHVVIYHMLYALLIRYRQMLQKKLNGAFLLCLTTYFTSTMCLLQHVIDWCFPKQRMQTNLFSFFTCMVRCMSGLAGAPALFISNTGSGRSMSQCVLNTSQFEILSHNLYGNKGFSINLVGM